MPQPLTEEQWNLVADLFSKPVHTGRPRRDQRVVLNGVLWVLQTGCSWRDLPAEFGSWKTCWRMFDQWNADGTLTEVLHRLQITGGWSSASSSEEVENANDDASKTKRKPYDPTD